MSRVRAWGALLLVGLWLLLGATGVACLAAAISWTVMLPGYLAWTYQDATWMLGYLPVGVVCLLTCKGWWEATGSRLYHDARESLRGSDGPRRF